jgi:spore cortex formation protein SpoVR/YcgB (stage V sporulation)
MTTNPTLSDLENYPEICNTRWQDSLMDIVSNYGDIDFISRYLTEGVIQRCHLFAVDIDNPHDMTTISGTANNMDTIREVLCRSLDVFAYAPRLEITGITAYVDGTNELNISAHCLPGMQANRGSISDIETYIGMLWCGKVIVKEIESD